MSAQNNLKKPVFTKTMLGYTPKEVDQYIEYMNERYAAVSRDVTDLRRRVMRLQFTLDSAKEAEAANEAPESGFSDDAIERLRSMIESERKRHEEALDALLGFIESHSHGEAIPERAKSDEAVLPEDPEDPESGFVPLTDGSDEPIISEDDAEWEEALEKFISDAGDEEGSEDPDDYADAEAVFAAPISGAYLEKADTPAEVSEDGKAPEEEKKPEASPERKKTPAEIAAELDFYSDDVVRDGESYDPMTLAQSSTMKRRRPTLEDFMNPIDGGQSGK